MGTCQCPRTCVSSWTFVSNKSICMYVCMYVRCQINFSEAVYTMQRETDSTVADFARQMVGATVDDAIVMLRTRLDVIRRQCQVNNETSEFRECWLGFNEVMISSAMLLWSPELRGVLLLHTSDCSRFIALLSQFEETFIAVVERNLERNGMKMISQYSARFYATSAFYELFSRL